MTKIVYYRFQDNWTRSRRLIAWKRRHAEEARRCVFIEAVPWQRDSRAKRLGLVFLHDGSEAGLKAYAWYKEQGVPEENVASEGGAEAREAEAREEGVCVRAPKAVRRRKKES